MDIRNKISGKSIQNSISNYSLTFPLNGSGIQISNHCVKEKEDIIINHISNISKEKTKVIDIRSIKNIKNTSVEVIQAVNIID